MEHRMKYPKSKRLIFLCVCSFVFSFLLSSEGAKDYKVLVGLTPEKVSACRGYAKLVIDAEFFSKDDIAQLHKNGNKQIFSYLNIGSLENFRSDYAEFENLTLDQYENWSEERWVNVASAKWQKRIVRKAEALLAKGIDGFFLDNADVYYQYETEEIYNGLLSIFRHLSRYHLPIIVNGGDVFISAAIKTNDLAGLITGVNQECVFTDIDFEKKRGTEKPAEERAYFQEYLQECSEYGLEVYLLEYGTSKKLQKQITQYCKAHGFTYDISPSINLDTP